MQNDKFNELLSKRAKGFVLTPNENVFENILARKNKQKNTRKIFVILAFAFCFLLSSIITITYYFRNKSKIIVAENISNNLLKKSIKNDTKKILFPSTIVENKEQSKDTKSKKNLEVYKSKKHTFDSLKSAVIKNESKEKVKSIKPVISSNKNIPFLTENQLINIKENTAKLFENNEIVLTKIDTIKPVKEVNILTKKNIVNTIDSTTKTDIDLPKNSIKPLNNFGFQLALFNNYMFLIKAYNGGNNEIIKSKFGINYNEQAKQAYSVGMMAGLYKNKFTFSIGLAYNYIEFDKIYKLEDMSKTIIKMQGNMNDAGFYINVIDHSLSFIEIPVILAYKIGNKKLCISTEIGTAIQFLAQTQTFTLQNDSLDLSPTTTNEFANNRFDKIQYLFFSSVLAQYNISKNVSFYAGPTVRMHLNQYYKNEFTNKPAAQFVGLSSGIKFIF